MALTSQTQDLPYCAKKLFYEIKKTILATTQQKNNW